MTEEEQLAADTVRRLSAPQAVFINSEGARVIDLLEKEFPRA